MSELHHMLANAKSVKPSEQMNKIISIIEQLIEIREALDKRTREGWVRG